MINYISNVYFTLTEDFNNCKLEKVHIGHCEGTTNMLMNGKLTISFKDNITEIEGKDLEITVLEQKRTCDVNFKVINENSTGKVCGSSLFDLENENLSVEDYCKSFQLNKM